LSPDTLRTAAAERLTREPGIDLEYLEVVDPETLAPPSPPSPPTSPSPPSPPSPPERLLVALAARVGPVRLIDNVEVGDLDDEQRLLHATAATPAED
jgi:pantoate--beta-alanine ligase